MFSSALVGLLVSRIVQKTTRPIFHKIRPKDSTRATEETILELELSQGQSAGSRCYYRQIQAPVENVFVFSVPVQLTR